MNEQSTTADLDHILRTRVRATFRHRVDFERIDPRKIDEIKRWCETNCRDIWKFNYSYGDIGGYYLQFDDDQDAMMFVLKWGSQGGVSAQ